MKRQTDYETAVQELDGPAEARVSRFVAWLCFKLMALFCRLEYWLGHRTLTPSPNRPVVAAVLHARECANPMCRRLHTQGSLFCSPECNRAFLGATHPDIFKGLSGAPICDGTDNIHRILPKPRLPRIPVPMPILRRGKVVR